MFTASERALLQGIGPVIYYNFIFVAPTTALYGLFMLLFSFSTYILLQRGLSARPTRIWLVTTSTSFLLTTTYWCCLLTVYTIQIQGALITSAGTLDHAVIAGVSNRIAGPELVQAWITQTLFIISDGVVLWRTWALYSERRWTFLAPCALFVGTIATSLTYLVLQSNVSAIINNGRGNAGDLQLTTTRLFTASLALSLASNLTSTLLILYKLWSYLRFRRKMGLKSRSTSPVHRVMVVLVESGFTYFVIQAFTFILSFIQNTEITAATVVSGTLQSILTMGTAMYPSIIVVLVSEQRSMAETFNGFSIELKNDGTADPESMAEDHDAESPQPDSASLVFTPTTVRAEPFGDNCGTRGSGSATEEKRGMSEKIFAAGNDERKHIQEIQR
ncbi:hypothetical protein FPV67DRAFT_1737259 [Lyophyllum atratum]|nr:hypothetical protein FPV67DRAFT_1737259 [Lyophyllum atratum]